MREGRTKVKNFICTYLLALGMAIQAKPAKIEPPENLRFAPFQEEKYNVAGKLIEIHVFTVDWKAGTWTHRIRYTDGRASESRTFPLPQFRTGQAK